MNLDTVLRVYVLVSSISYCLLYGIYYSYCGYILDFSQALCRKSCILAYFIV